MEVGVSVTTDSVSESSLKLNGLDSSLNPDGDPEEEDEDALVCDADLEVNPYDGLPFSSRYYELLKQRKELAVWGVKYGFLESLESSSVVLVSGNPGSGKSTQESPRWAKYCLLTTHIPNPNIYIYIYIKQTVRHLKRKVCVQSRINSVHTRPHALTLVFCCLIFLGFRGYCTDEMLLSEMMSDPLLYQYGVLIIDEAHQRTVATDVLLGLLKDVPKQRPELKIVVITAPGLAERLHRFYGDVPLVRAEEQESATPLVDVVYRDAQSRDRVLAACHMVLDIHRKGELGDVMVFLASEKEVLDCCGTIQTESVALNPQLGELVPFPLHSGTGGAFQRIYEPQEHAGKGYRRKVVVTTSLADSSFSLSNLRYVIDTGMEKTNRTLLTIHPRVLSPSPQLCPGVIGQSHITSSVRGVDTSGQWCCRACFRLYSEGFYEKEMPDLSPPQVSEANLSHLVLLLKRLDIADMGQCDFLDRPAPEALMQALEDLDYLAALDDDGNLSEVGIIMSEFPLDPQLAKALIASCEFDCVNEMLTIAAMLTAPPCFLAPPALCDESAAAHRRVLLHPEGDHFTLINVYNAFKQRKQLEIVHYTIARWIQSQKLNFHLETHHFVASLGMPPLSQNEKNHVSVGGGGSTETLNLKKKKHSCRWWQVARDVDGAGNYLLLTHKHVAHLHPFSCYLTRRPLPRPPSWVLYHEFTISQDNCISVVSEIQLKMLVEFAPQYYLSNLPASESRDLLMELWQKLTGDGEQPEESEAAAAAETEPSNRENEELCVIQ
uniref:Helicase ATP-binding domain-containing protein n=1 Tax=Latimeria chalumnae TaxID=7897 RepID=H3AFF5_LATCH